MDLKQLILLSLQLSIVCTVLGFGLKASGADFRYLFERPGLLLRSLLAVLVVMPLVALLLSRLFDFRPTTEMTLLALAISPVPPLLPQRETKGGGSGSYGLALMGILGILAIVTVPLSASLVQPLTAYRFVAPLGTTARVIMISIVVPLAVGMFIRARRPVLADRIDPVVTLVGKILLPIAALALLAGAWEQVWNAIGGGTVIAILLFVVAGLVIGHLFGEPEPEHSVVLALSTACRHPALAFAIASANYPDLRFGGTILLYLLLNIVVSVLYLVWRHSASRPAVVSN